MQEHWVSERMKRAALLALSVLTWAFAVVVGFLLLIGYETTAGGVGPARPCWPTGSGLRPEPGRANLLVFLHPRCPCSRATLDELAKVLTHCPDRAAVWVVFVRPPGFAAGWERTALWERAASLPGVRVLADGGGVEARRFGAATSGQVLLYGPDGGLLFHGGITGSRGHSGDNPGGDALSARLTRESIGLAETPVYGCPLHDSEEREP